LVYSNTILTEDVTMKFLQPEHTYMRMDSFHHSVEQEMESRPGGALYDFSLFVMGNSNSKTVEMAELRKEGCTD
jgi:hypothetical protein